MNGTSAFTALIAGISAAIATAATAAWFRGHTMSSATSARMKRQPFVEISRSASSNETSLRPAAKVDPYASSPRIEYLSWDDYFMALAFLSAQRSKDPNKQVGAVLVSREDNLILGIGYNGFPRGCPDNELPWAKLSHSGDVLETKYPYVCHAEMNAVLNKNTATLHGAKLYVTMFCCSDCAKLLIQAGVKEIVFFEGKSATFSETLDRTGMLPEQSYVAARRMLRLAGVKMRQFRPRQQLCIRFGAY